MSEPVLVITNSRDYACDLVITEVRRLNVPYVRIDIDLLNEDRIALNPHIPSLTYAQRDGNSLEIVTPRSILYRAPTHLRESSGHRYSPEEALSNHQWAAFARSLMVFRNAKWINHPAETYVAENKPYQLAVATAVGFVVPQTAVTNYLPTVFQSADRVAVKALDSFLVRLGGEDLFFYTTPVAVTDLSAEDLQEMPVIMQPFLAPKTDLRVTVVGERCFAAATSFEVVGDWRMQKDRVTFVPVDLPREVEAKCCSVATHLGLRYGAIDLALVDGSYYFIEINPTGEWAWLEEIFEGEIARALALELTRA